MSSLDIDSFSSATTKKDGMSTAMKVLLVIVGILIVAFIIVMVLWQTGSFDSEDDKPADDKPADDKPADGKSGDGKSAGDNVTVYEYPKKIKLTGGSEDQRNNGVFNAIYELLEADPDNTDFQVHYKKGNMNLFYLGDLWQLTTQPKPVNNPETGDWVTTWGYVKAGPILSGTNHDWHCWDYVSYKRHRIQVTVST